MSDDPTSPTTAPNRRDAALALALLVPAPSLGILAATFGAGELVWGASKVWLLVFPLLWLLLRERGKVSWSPPRHGGLWVGLLSGIVIFFVVLGAHKLVGRQLIGDTSQLSKLMGEKGISTATRYLLLVVYLSLVNSLTEEYVWRWFVFSKCEALTSRTKSVLLSAFLFSVHHFVVLAIYFDVLPALIATGGVFAAGVIWSGLYLRYRSVWPGYLSHIGADAAVFLVGWELLGFG